MKYAAWGSVFIGVLLLVTGCQTEKLAVPPPTFAPPVVRADTVRLPSIAPPQQPVTPAASAQEARRAGVQQVAPEQLISGSSLKPQAPSRPWKYIIIHHSDTDYGSALRFHRAHVARGWDMLGYDFVIGNGTETRDGLIEVGPRWIKQLPGAHTGTPDHLYNDYGIGICLVGNFDETRPTAKQMDSLARLVAYMMKTYGIPASNVIGHRDAKSTRCPGRYMDINRVRVMAKAYLAK